LFTTGGSPIEKHVKNFIQVVCSAPMIESYASTECDCITITDSKDPEVGHVGGPMMNLKVRLRDVPDLGYLTTDKPYPRGELCVKGESVTPGYFKRPEETANSFDEDGWFLTGDVGCILPNGAIEVIDRCKNIIKIYNNGPAYIAPERIQGFMTLCPFISSAFVYSDFTVSYVVAIIVLSPEVVQQWMAKSNYTEPIETVLTNETFRDLIRKDIDRIA